MPGVSAGEIVAEKYRVERMLGSGGMGYVVAARHLSLDQLVAIKFLTKGALEDAEATARFKREARAASRLKNEHVTKVFDVGVHANDEPFIVMEYLDGSDLGAIAKQRGALAVSEAAEYVLQACEALAEAHSLGIIHRDVKPGNLFLTRTASGWPLVKVLDFGVSKTLVNAEAQGDVTKTAAMLGSPKYMSPEQMNDARSVDGRADVWSLGVVLYRLVTGQQPFAGDTIGRLCMAVLAHDPPPVTAHRPDAPPAFAAVVARCLEKDRTRRFANVAELAAGLGPFCVDPERTQATIERIANVLGVPAPPMGWMPPLLPEGTNPAWSAPNEGIAKTRPELVLAAALAALLVALGVVGVVMLRKTPQPVPVPVPAAVATPPSTDTTPAVTPPPPPPKAIESSEPVPTASATKPAAPVAKKPKAPAKPATTSNNGELFPSDRK